MTCHRSPRLTVTAGLVGDVKGFHAVSSGLNNMLLLRTPVTCIAIVIEYVLDPQLLKAEKKECRMLAIGHVDYPDYCFWLEHYLFFFTKVKSSISCTYPCIIYTFRRYRLKNIPCIVVLYIM